MRTFLIVFILFCLGVTTTSCSLEDDVVHTEQATGGGIDDPVEPDEE